jgi:hypothetical protein
VNEGLIISPSGTRNDSLLMMKRPTANGVSLSEHTAPSSQSFGGKSRVFFSTYRDRGMDMFQLGRADSNDLITRGYFPVESAGRGTVSHLACRILCERSPPHRAFLFAGSPNSNQVYIHVC